MKQMAYGGRLGNGFLGNLTYLSRLTATDVVSAPLDFIASSFSVSIWFTPTAVGGIFPYRTLVLKGRQLADCGYAIGFREDINVFYFGFNKGTNTFNIPGGYAAIYYKPTHVVMTYDLATTTLKMYLNKVLIYSNASMPALSAASYLVSGSNRRELTIMSESEFTNRAVPGCMAQANFYNKALSVAEVTQEYDFEGCRPIVGNLVEGFGLNQKNGLTTTGRNGMVLNVAGYSAAQVADGVNPQSGNIGWGNAYTLLPITS